MVGESWVLPSLFLVTLSRMSLHVQAAASLIVAQLFLASGLLTYLVVLFS